MLITKLGLHFIKIDHLKLIINVIKTKIQTIKPLHRLNQKFHHFLLRKELFKIQNNDTGSTSSLRKRTYFTDLIATADKIVEPVRFCKEDVDLMSLLLILDK